MELHDSLTYHLKLDTLEIPKEYIGALYLKLQN